jgi:hypothetical protein
MGVGSPTTSSSAYWPWPGSDPDPIGCPRGEQGSPLPRSALGTDRTPGLGVDAGVVGRHPAHDGGQGAVADHPAGVPIGEGESGARSCLLPLASCAMQKARPGHFIYLNTVVRLRYPRPRYPLLRETGLYVSDALVQHIYDRLASKVPADAQRKTWPLPFFNLLRPTSKAQVKT